MMRADPWPALPDLDDASGDAPLLVLAGPGTGKTTLLIEQLAVLVTDTTAGPPPLAVTFSRRAGRDLRRRLAERVGPILAARARITTCHALGRAIVAAWPEAVGLRPGRLTVASPRLVAALLVEALTASGQAALTPLAVALLPAVAAVRQGLPPPPGANRLLPAAALLAVARAFEVRLREHQVIDYVGMVTLPLAVLVRCPAALQAVQASARAILIDELQDLTRLQWLLLLLLADRPRRLLAVGDPLQSIYRWRGSWPGSVDHLRAVYPRTRLVPLVHTFRCRAPIVAVANALARPLVASDPLVAVQTVGPPVVHRQLADEQAEAGWVVTEIRRLLATGVVATAGHIAILCRSHAQRQVMIAACRHAGLPVSRPAGSTTSKVASDTPASDGDRARPEHLLAAATGEWGPAGEDEDDEPGRRTQVAVLTMHAAKGLEFDAVFVTGWEEGSLPGRQALGSPVALADERRLAYVAVTRARDRLYLTGCHRRAGQPRHPSRFLAELPVADTITPSA